MSIEVMKQMIDTLKIVEPQSTVYSRLRWDGLTMTQLVRKAIEVGEKAIADAEQAQPVAWMMVNPTHSPQSKSLHWEPQQWHITWEAVPLYTNRSKE